MPGPWAPNLQRVTFPQVTTTGILHDGWREGRVGRRRFRPAGRRESPARRLRGAEATSLDGKTSPNPRTATPRGRDDVPGPRGVANPPHTGRAGPKRRSRPRVCRESPAQRLCGAGATFPSPGLSPIPRAVPVRGRGDVSGPRGVANPPHGRRAGPRRRFRPRVCRQSPARQPCGAEATPTGGAGRPSGHQQTRLIDSQSGTIPVPSGSASSEPRRGTPWRSRCSANATGSSVSPKRNLIMTTL